MVSVYMLTYSTSSSDQNESNGSIEITREAQDIPGEEMLNLIYLYTRKCFSSNIRAAFDTARIDKTTRKLQMINILDVPQYQFIRK